MMSITARLTSLESALNRSPGDGLQPCEHCGAPEHSIRSDGLRIVLIPDDSMDRDCEHCGRAIDPDSGMSIVSSCVVKLLRSEPITDGRHGSPVIS